MAYAKINTITNANMAKVFNVAKAGFGKIASIDAPAGCTATALSTNGYSIAFDGTNDYIATAADATAQDATYSFWMKSSTSGDNKGIFGHGNAATGGFGIWADRPLAYFGGGWQCYWEEDAKTDDGNWHHWMMFVDISAIGSSKLYIDGTLIGVDQVRSYGSLNSYTNGIYIGRSHNDYFTGNIDEFAIFTGDKTLCAATYYNKGTPTDLSSESNLLGYWRMEENTGTSIADDSSNSNTGTLTNGAAFASDVAIGFDSASIAFDGVNDNFTVDGAADTITGDLGSVSIWFKLNTTAFVPWLYEIWADDNNVVRAYYHGSTNKLTCIHIGGGNEAKCETTTAVENNGWHHLAFTWDTGENESKMYLDGSSADTGTASSDFDGDFTSVNVGIRGHGWSSSTWDGNVNDMAFFDDVLTSGEISTIYNSKDPKDESSHSGLVGYWKVENNTTDSSSNSNALTLVNGATYAFDVP